MRRIGICDITAEALGHGAIRVRDGERVAGYASRHDVTGRVWIGPALRASLDAGGHDMLDVAEAIDRALPREPLPLLGQLEAWDAPHRNAADAETLRRVLDRRMSR